MSASASSTARWAPSAVLTATLVVFAGVIGYIGFWLRAGLHDQVLQREAEALSEVASLQLTNEAATLAQLGLPSAPGDLLNAALKTSKLRGVFAVRVFDAERKFSGALPVPWSEVPPTAEQWASLVAGKPLARLHSRESAAEVIGLAPPESRERSEPLLETWLPLRSGDATALAGAAQMWIDGRAVAREFAAVDTRLWTQALIAWAAGALIIGLLLTWAFRRLAAANRELQARTDDLVQANRELALAAKTSALGSVAAHLMHELKNPVAGLEEWMAAQADVGTAGEPAGALSAASELTRRLRTMITDVAAVMRDEQHGADFTLTAAEVVELAIAKVAPVARGRAVTLESAVTANDSLPGRRANLTLLVLQNLLQNAVEATPAGGGVSLRAERAGLDLHFVVEDNGSGLSAAVRSRLFQPCASTKAGGSGLGLALSQQLARQAGGRIELVHTGEKGTRFDLVFHSGS